MTAIVVNAIRRGIFGSIKFISVQTDVAADDGHTLDLNSDIGDGRGAEMKEILNTLLQDDLGEDFISSWDPATGIITFGNGNVLTTGIHNMLIIGR